MTSPENILLSLSEQDERLIAEIFAQLADQGFPPQQQTPHITITFAPRMAQEVIDLAAELLPAVVPATFHRVGTVVFGTKRKRTLAWLLETSDELEQVARRISARNPEGRGSRWVPHLTMGLRLPKEIVPDYVRALDELVPSSIAQLRAERASLWRPHVQETTVLAGE